MDKDQLLSEVAASQLIGELVANHRTDCGRIDSALNGKDVWGNSIRIYTYQSKTNSRPRLKIVSNGPDGIESTDDNIVVQSPERAEVEEE
jgi:hypothetical protein